MSAVINVTVKRVDATAAVRSVATVLVPLARGPRGPEGERGPPGTIGGDIPVIFDGGNY